MRSIPLLAQGIRTGTLLFATTLAVACMEQVTEPGQDAPSIRAAKGGNGNGNGGGGGGGGGGKGGKGPTVNDVDPAGAPQGTRLNVRVFGSGYDATAAVEMLLGGVPTGDITTHSTTFVSDTEVIADITIAADAVTTLYDVEVTVTAAGGPKRGVGAEKFEVFLSLESPTLGGIIASEPAGGPELPMVRGETDSPKKLSIHAGEFDGDAPDPVVIRFAFNAFSDADCQMIGSAPGITKADMITVLRGGDPPPSLGNPGPGGFREGADNQARLVVKIKKDRLGIEHKVHRISAGKQDINGLWWWFAEIGALGENNRRAMVTAEPVTPPPGDSRTWTKYTWVADRAAILKLSIVFGPEVVLECPYTGSDEVSITVIEKNE